MAKPGRRHRNLKGQINAITGVTSNMNGANGRHMVGTGRGREQRIGNRRAKYREIRAAFGLSTG